MFKFFIRWIGFAYELVTEMSEELQVTLQLEKRRPKPHLATTTITSRVVQTIISKAQGVGSVCFNLIN